MTIKQEIFFFKIHFLYKKILQNVRDVCMSFLIWCFAMPSFHYLLLQSNNKRKPQATGTQENSITFNKKSFINNELLQLVRRNACPNQFKHWHDVGYLSIKAFSLCVVNLENAIFIIFHSDKIFNPLQLYLALVYIQTNNRYLTINFIV